MPNTKKFGMSLAEISSPRPATKRILIEVGVDGSISVSSTLPDAETTVQLLDEAMESVDGKRLPPDGE